jgi:hypothetical protein
MALAVQMLGALLVLTGFALAQTGHWRTDAYPYLLANLAGSAILTTCAAVEEQWGFVLLNSVWGTVAAVSLVRRWRGDRGQHLISS